MPGLIDHLTKPEFWQQQWVAFTSAIWIMLPLFLLIVWVVWWLSGTRSAGTIAGLIGEKGVLEQRLKAETSLLEQRLKYAEEVRAASNKTNDELDELKKRIDAMEVVAAKADYASLSESVAEIRSSIGKVSAANNAVTMKLNVTEAPDVASFALDTTKFEALRNLDGLGALRKLEYETLEKLQDVGKPSLTDALKRITAMPGK
jgi:hypothetical protein